MLKIHFLALYQGQLIVFVISVFTIMPTPFGLYTGVAVSCSFLFKYMF